MSSDYDTDCIGNTSSISISTSLDESSLDGVPPINQSSANTASVSEAIANLVSAVSSKEDLFMVELYHYHVIYRT